MRKSNRWLTTTYSALLAAGLFCAQVCQVVCAAALCANEAQAVQAEPEHAHCHQASQPAKKTQPESLPTAPNQSHDCQQHPLLQSLPPDSQLAKVGGPQTAWPAEANAALLSATFASAPTIPQPLAVTHFRPPPRSWLTTVQRI
jgi:hypothetical protein